MNTIAKYGVAILFDVDLGPYNFIATDADGSVFAFIEKPERLDELQTHGSLKGMKIVGRSEHAVQRNWKDTLTQLV